MEANKIIPTAASRKERQSNFELLRVLAMTVMIGHHFSVHGGYDFASTELTLVKLWHYFFYYSGKIAFVAVVLISGYFLVMDTSRKIHWGKLLKLWVQISFYSSVIYLGNALYTGEFSALQCFYSFLPITRREWWFASAYFVLFITYPYINILLHSLDKKKYQQLVLLLMAIWCVCPTITKSDLESNRYLLLVLLYIVAGYLRLHGLSDGATKRLGWAAWGIAAVSFLTAMVFTVLGSRFPFLAENSAHLFGTNKFPTLIMAIYVFVVFSKLKIKNNQLINRLASTMFGVYLIHDSTIIRPLLWQKRFHWIVHYNSLGVIPYSIAVVLVVYGVCSLIDILRQETVERLYLHIAKRCSPKVTELFQRTSDWFTEFFFGE